LAALVLLFATAFIAALYGIRRLVTALLTERLLAQANAGIGRAYRTPQEAEEALVKAELAQVGFVAIPDWAVFVEIGASIVLAGAITLVVHRALQRRVRAGQP
jgi:hypothetical protein